jgi:hypothetical protein
MPDGVVSKRVESQESKYLPTSSSAFFMDGLRFSRNGRPKMLAVKIARCDF